jgi:uncharacterized iron-regulated membrane protein
MSTRGIMSLNELPHEKAGLGATVIVLLVLAGIIAILFIALWLQRKPLAEPTQPRQATKPSSELRAPVFRLPAADGQTPVQCVELPVA